MSTSSRVRVAGCDPRIVKEALLGHGQQGFFYLRLRMIPVILVRSHPHAQLTN